MTSKEIKTLVTEMVRSELDELFVSHAFRRTTASLIFDRKSDRMTQSVDIEIRRLRSRSADVEAQISPKLRLYAPEVAAATRELLAPDPQDAEGVSDYILSVNIGIISPGPSYLAWVVRGPDDVSALGTPIRNYMDRWVIPFLDDYSSVEAVAGSYEREPERLPFMVAWQLCVAGAKYLQGDREGAAVVMETISQRSPTMADKCRRWAEAVRNADAAS